MQPAERPFRYLTRDEFDLLTREQQMDYLTAAQQELRRRGAELRALSRKLLDSETPKPD